MHVLLVNPPFNSRYSLGVSYGEPLGLAYIAGAIEADGTHSVEVVDGIGLAQGFPKKNGILRIGVAEDELLSILKIRNSDIIGLALISTLHAPEILALIARIKTIHPKTPIVVGGSHATLEWEACLKAGSIDYIVLGEGEGTMVDLLHSLADGHDPAAVAGLAYRNKNGVPVRTANREPLEIDSIALPARHLLPMRNYFAHQPRHYYMRYPVATIITSRACPYNCIFCSTTLFWGHRYRGRNPVAVVDEIEMLQREFGIREFLINDDCFLGNKQRVLNICAEIKRRKLDIRFQIPPGVNLHVLDETLLRELKDAGLYAIQPEFETGNPATVHYIRKPIDLEKGRKIIKLGNRLGLWTKTNIIIGFPHETREDIERSISFAVSLQVDAVNFLLPIPYRHTDLGKDYVKLGIVPEELSGEDYARDSLHCTVAELEELRQSAIRRFNVRRIKRLMSPRYVLLNLLPKISTPERLGLFIRRMLFGAFRFLYRDL